MAYVKKKACCPSIWWVSRGLCGALFRPLYRPTHYIMAALVSAIVYYIAKMIWPDRGYEVQDTKKAEPSARAQTQAQAAPQPEKKEEKKPETTGNPEIDALITERDRAVSEMRRLNDAIADPKISAQISQLEAHHRQDHRCGGGEAGQAAPDPAVHELLPAHHPEAPQRLRPDGRHRRLRDQHRRHQGQDRGHDGHHRARPSTSSWTPCTARRHWTSPPTSPCWRTCWPRRAWAA